MSWDAVILKIQGPVRPVEDVADEEYLPLGSIESVAERIRSAFPAAEWSSPTWATWGLDGDTGVTIDLEGVESSHSILVSVSGSGNPVPHLLSLARANDWVVLDCSTTEFLSPDENSSEGWEGYQSLLGGVREPILDRVDESPPQAPEPAPPVAPPVALQQPPPEAPPQTPPLTPRPAAPEPPPRAAKKKKAVKPKKKKAAKKVRRKVKRQTAAKKTKPRKKSGKKKVTKKRPKKKVSGKKAGAKKATAKKSARKKTPKKKK